MPRQGPALGKGQGLGLTQWCVGLACLTAPCSVASPARLSISLLQVPDDLPILPDDVLKFIFNAACKNITATVPGIRASAAVQHFANLASTCRFSRALLLAACPTMALNFSEAPLTLRQLIWLARPAPMRRCHVPVIRVHPAEEHLFAPAFESLHGVLVALEAHGGSANACTCSLRSRTFDGQRAVRAAVKRADARRYPCAPFCIWPWPWHIPQSCVRQHGGCAAQQSTCMFQDRPS